MPRELRVRSPLINRQGPPALTISAGTKRKLNGADFSLRRSTRGVESFDVPVLSEEPIQARWDGQVLTISGVPADALAEDGGALDAEDTNTDNDSQDNATWEEKWMGSPTKRRRLGRSAQDSRLYNETRSHDHADAKLQRSSRRSRYDELEDGKPRPKAIERLSRATAGRHSADPSTGSSSRQSSPSSIRRRYSLAPPKAIAHQASPSINGQKTDEHDASNISTPAHSPSPPLSTVTTPEPDDAENELLNGRDDNKQDPDALNDHDLPGPHLEADTVTFPDTFEDEAERILRHLYPPIPPPQRFIKALTSHHPSKRSTETLKALAENAQRALRVWQDEYIRLDKRTGPVSLPFPKKPCTGGRIPANPDDFELEKYKELYTDGSKLAAAMGIVVPSATHRRTVNGAPADAASGRELRRRGVDTRLVDGLGISSDDAGAKKPTRARKPVRRFDAGRNTHLADVAITPAPVPVPPVVSASKDVVEGKRPRPAPTLEQQAPQKKRRRRRGPDKELYWPEDMPEAKRRFAMAMNDKTNGSVQPIASAADVITKAEDHDVQGRIFTDGASEAGLGTGSGVPLATSADEETPTREMSPGESAALADKKARAKSLKRSESMTAWWAQRKKKLAEDQIKEQYSRGGIHEGHYNVDSLKGWTQNDGASPAPGRLMPSPGATIDPHYASWLAQYSHDPRVAAQMHSLWQQSYQGGGVPYPYGPYGWPAGAQYDPRIYQQPLSASHQHGQPTRDQRHLAATAQLPPPATQVPPTPLAGPSQTLTPSHPFAHPPQPSHHLSHQRPPPPPPPLHNTHSKPLPPPTPSTQPTLRDPYPHHYQRNAERRPSAARSTTGPELNYHHYHANYLPPYPSEKRVGSHARTTSSSSSSWANAPPPPPPPTTFTAPPPPPPPKLPDASPRQYYSSNRQAHEHDTSLAHYAHKRSGSQSNLPPQPQIEPREHTQQQPHQHSEQHHNHPPPQSQSQHHQLEEVPRLVDQQHDHQQHDHEQEQQQPNESQKSHNPQDNPPSTPASASASAAQNERPTSQHLHQHHSSDPDVANTSVPQSFQQISPPRRGSLPHQPHALYQRSPTERTEPSSQRMEPPAQRTASKNRPFEL